MLIIVSVTETDALLTTVSITQTCVIIRETGSLEAQARLPSKPRPHGRAPSGRASSWPRTRGSGGGRSDRHQLVRLAPDVGPAHEPAGARTVSSRRARAGPRRAALPLARSESRHGIRLLRRLPRARAFRARGPRLSLVLLNSRRHA